MSGMKYCQAPFSFASLRVVAPDFCNRAAFSAVHLWLSLEVCSSFSDLLLQQEKHPKEIMPAVANIIASSEAIVS